MNSEIAYTVPAGTGVAIVATSGYAIDQDAVARGVTLLQASGCTVHNYYEPSSKFERFGGTDEARLAQLHAAVRNPDVQIVLALRGGYGLSRLLPSIDFDLLAASGKLFVGHSDFTVLQLAMLARTGAASFSGPLLCDDFSREDPCDFTLGDFWRCVRGPSHIISANTTYNPAVDVSGTLWGGNLSMLSNLIGTPYMPRVEKGILFVEDVNEHPYRVERMMLQLLHAGLLEGQQAILLGDISRYRLTDYDNGYDFDSMLAYLRATLPVPILTGLPFGHLREKATLVVGSQARLFARRNSIDLTMSAYPTL